MKINLNEKSCKARGSIFWRQSIKSNKVVLLKTLHWQKTSELEFEICDEKLKLNERFCFKVSREK